MAESLPPLSLDDLITDLENEFFTGYVYIGSESDPGWKNAIKAQSFIPALRVYRADPQLPKSNPAADRVRAEFEVDDAVVGLVFGWSSKLKKGLTLAQANDPFVVMDAIWKAQG